MSRRSPSARDEFELYARIVDRFWAHELADFHHDPRAMTRRLNARALLSLWREMLSVEKAPEIDCYVHVPYCRHVCHFCSLFPEQLSRPDQLERYARSLADEAAFYAPSFAGRPLANLYFGGGTPSLLEERQLESVLDALGRGFSFDPAAEKTFELHPASATPEKLALLKSRGFTRASMGVQSFDPAVLAQANRSDQTAGSVARAAELAMKHLPVLNLDLILGLEGDAPETFLRSFRRTVELQPQEICVYVNKAEGTQIKLFHEGSRSRFLERRDLRRLHIDQVKEGMDEIAGRFGYGRESVGTWAYEYRFRRKPLAPRARRRGYSSDPQGNVSCLSLGVRARSRVAGRLSYAADPSRRSFDPDKTAYSGMPVGRKDETLRFVMNQILERSRLSPAEFEENFGSKLEEHFPQAMGSLRGLGTVKIKNGQWRFSRSSRARLAHAFFFAGPPRVREWLDRRHSSKNELVVTLKGFRFCAWIERAEEGRAYAARRGSRGLVANFAGSGKAPAALEQVVRRLLAGAFLGLEAAADLSGPEMTFLLHEKVGAVLSRSKKMAEHLSLSPWIDSRHNTGLGL